MHPNAKDITGRRFGRLVVVRRAGTATNREVLWDCLCDCGAIKAIRSSHLNCQRTLSCGCLARETAAEMRRGRPAATRGEAGASSFNSLLSAYQGHARRAGRTWALDREHCRRLFTDPCFYCGCAPGQTVVRPGLYGSYVYNGIDRLDNAEGYTPANVVSCCKTCNRAKRMMGVEEFCQWAKRLYAHLTQTGLLEGPNP